MQKTPLIIKGKPHKCLYSEYIRRHSKGKTVTDPGMYRSRTEQQTGMHSEHLTATSFPTQTSLLRGVPITYSEAADHLLPIELSKQKCCQGLGWESTSAPRH